MLNGRRQVGMIANPISEMQIEAFARLHGVEVTPVDFDLLCRVDSTVLAALDQPSTNPDAVPAKDGAGAAALMRGMGAKKSGKASNGSPERRHPG